MKLTLESCKYCEGEGKRGFFLNAGHLIRNVHCDEQEARQLFALLQAQIDEWDKETKERKDHAD